MPTKQTVFTIIAILVVLYFLRNYASGAEGRRENFFQINWDQMSPAHQSFGQSNVLQELNRAVWDTPCRPHGEFYVMRYSQPLGCLNRPVTQRRPITTGYYNQCGETVSY